MINCLQQYEQAYGQKINFEKSSVSFSANVSGEVRANICGLLDVPLESNAGRFLGMPSLIGRNKKATFAYIKEKICNRLQGLEQQISI